MFIAAVLFLNSGFFIHAQNAEEPAIVFWEKPLQPIHGEYPIKVQIAPEHYLHSEVILHIPGYGQQKMLPAGQGIYEYVWPSQNYDDDYYLLRASLRSNDQIYYTEQVSVTVANAASSVFDSSNLEVFFDKPSDSEAILAGDLPVAVRSSHYLESLTINIFGQASKSFPVNTNLNTSVYETILDLSNFLPGHYSLRAEASRDGITATADLEISILDPLLPSLVHYQDNADSDLQFNNSGEDTAPYLYFADEGSIIAHSKYFVVSSDLGVPEIMITVQGPRSGHWRALPSLQPGSYSFWWDLSAWPEGVYQFEARAEKNGLSLSDSLRVEYQIEKFIAAEPESRTEPYRLSFENPPSIDLSLPYTFTISSNYDLDKVELLLRSPDLERKFPAEQIDAKNWRWTFDSAAFKSGSYTLKAGGIIGGVVRSEQAIDLAIAPKTEAKEKISIEPVPDPLPAEKTEGPAGQPVVDQPAATDTGADNKQSPFPVAEKYIPDARCRDQGIMDPDKCREYLSLPPECQTAGKLDAALCRVHLSLDPACRLLGLDMTACREYLFLPDECRQNNLVNSADCRQYFYTKALPAVCREQGISTQRDCEIFLRSASLAEDPAVVGQFPDICAAAGISDQEKCQAFLREKYLARECRENDITDTRDCDDHLIARYSLLECDRAGIEDEDECRSYLFNQLSQTVVCRELDQAECFRLLHDRYLGRLVRHQQIFGEIIQDISDRYQGLSLSELAQKSPAISGSIPLVSDTALLRTVPAQAGNMIGPDADLNLGGPLALVYDSDNDGLPDCLEKRIGTDPYNPDTDGDGYGDREEILSGYNPLGPGLAVNLNLSAADEIFIFGQKLSHPRLSGELSAEYEVLEIENNSDNLANESGYLLKGKADPDRVLTIFIYSDMPLVATVKSDEFGNWQYELKDLLSEGGHEVYVVLNDRTGRVLKKSQPLNFFVKEARAVSVDEFLAASAAYSGKTETGSILKTYLFFSIIIIAFSIVVFLFLFTILKKQRT